MDIDRIIGHKIRKRRTEMRLSQKDFAEKMGVSGSFIGFIENGKRRINPTLLKRVSEITKRPISYFYGEKSADDTALKAFNILLSARREQKRK